MQDRTADSAAAKAPAGPAQARPAPPTPGPTDPAHQPTPTPTPTPTADPPAAADPYGPLPDEVKARLAAVPADPAPKQLIRHSHYYISNERNHQLWHDYVADLGGGYFGVGSDQNYMIAGWAKSDLIVVVDFDKAVIDLHAVYGLFFDLSATPDEFFERWGKSKAKEGLALINEKLAGRADLNDIVKAFKYAQPLVHARLNAVRKQYGKLGIPTFVTDQAQYDHIKKLWANGRVLAVRGDFTANQTMVALGKAMHDSGMQFNVLYLSNVEQYVKYTPEFRRNFLGLPVGDKAEVVRTLAWGGFGFVDTKEQYHYNVESASNWMTWLRTNRVADLPRLLRSRTPTKIHGLSVVEGDVPADAKPPDIAP